MSSDPIEVLREAATSLRTIARAAGREEFMESHEQVRGYAASRANVADAALASLSAPKPESAEAVAYARRLDDGQLGVISPKEYARLRGAGHGDGFRPLIYGDTAPSRPESAEEAWRRGLGLAPPRPEASDEVRVCRVGPYTVSMSDEDGGWVMVGEGRRIHAIVGKAPQQASAPVGVEAIIEAFDEITGLCRHLRQGGPAPEDLHDLSGALDEAIGIAWNMLAALAQQPAPVAPARDSLLQTALRNLPQYISKSGLVGPDKHSAMQCFEVLRDALDQQPAPSAPVGVEWVVPEGQFPANVEVDGSGRAVLVSYGKGHPSGRYVLAQQPAPVVPVGVDGLRRMVEKLAAHVRPTCCELWEEAQVALAQQPAAEVYVDFPQVGTAGPLAVVDGKVTLPDTTMNDLIRHARTGYVEQPAAVDPGDIHVEPYPEQFGGFRTGSPRGIKITHRSGLIVASTKERSAHANRDAAMRALAHALAGQQQGGPQE